GSDDNGVKDVFVRQGGETERVSVATDGTEGDGLSRHPSIDADGGLVVFESFATNLGPPGDDNDASDVFLRDRGGDSTTAITFIGSAFRPINYWHNGGSYDPAISASGNRIVWVSDATDMAP